MARQRLDFLIVILELVLVSQRDVSVRVPGHDGETASIEAAVVKPSEGAACAYRDGFYVISVEEVNRMPPLEHHLENKVSVLKEAYETTNLSSGNFQLPSLAVVIVKDLSAEMTGNSLARITPKSVDETNNGQEN